MTRVEEVTPEALRTRRSEILEELGVTVDDLEALADAGSLDPEQRDALQQLRDIAYLLGDD